MQLRFAGEVIEWRDPAPFLFVRVPDEEADAIGAVARQVTYGWGAIPATVRLGATEYTTSLLPREGGYLVPVKVAVHRAEQVGLSDEVALELLIDGV